MYNLIFGVFSNHNCDNNLYLKNNGLATEKKVLTLTVGIKDDTKGSIVQKAKASFF
ncbi:hypothetical protein ISN45_Aa04g004630 [Arabidopsis thaliana x Arabidopsis arenosa]|uniref:Uncharacterized protein n=1 Tax=Arabidopsis thaliana x Arabidopsis arenosa TaxID=1240361 RepID=A0A8T2A333_9BRAS|nr:hypothetical protein ISN45_Aa04g004630 [Arabidopsis thaliana x Arabidopsis arenosa]KAG7567609.1 hypothetical protein ISN45_Aa04g004630 [Arabidopsis thaliana x Arabidopsis arenosa]